jgi:hypothetical protein
VLNAAQLGFLSAGLQIGDHRAQEVLFQVKHLTPDKPGMNHDFNLGA